MFQRQFGFLLFYFLGRDVIAAIPRMLFFLLRLPTRGKTYYFRVDYYVFPLGGRRIVFVLIIITHADESRGVG